MQKKLGKKFLAVETKKASGKLACKCHLVAGAGFEPAIFEL